mmetsp:Transcript_612/g.1105  ORF Transcript_612/g.1105 Transcript_612/m.1105 type:complete len:264 (-) Transcript_612:351-1142(-)
MEDSPNKDFKKPAFESGKRLLVKGCDDAFLESMTFAGGKIGCDCEECGVVPPSIAEAVRRHNSKKIRLDCMPPPTRIVSQKRSLISRNGNLSIWKWSLPTTTAEPLTEFGNSHRIIWVQRLAPNITLHSIGKGIIGSSDEEKSRTTVNWKEGKGYLVPSNGGRALGWIARSNVSSQKEDNSKCEPVELVMIKMSQAGISQIHGKSTSDANWMNAIGSIFKQHVDSRDKVETSEVENVSPSDILLDVNDCCAIQSIISSFSDAS